MTTSSTIKSIVEAAIFAAEVPLTITQIKELFPESQVPETAALTETLESLMTDYEGRGVELVKVASGYRFQARAQYADWLQRLWQQRAPRYSRALLETLALIAYKQPLTRGEIEQVRGVAVSSNIIKTLLEREWVKVVGHRDVPGKPALLATTKTFLDYFNLSKLSDMPPLQELMDLDELGKQLGLEGVADAEQVPVEQAATELECQTGDSAEIVAESEPEVVNHEDMIIDEQAVDFGSMQESIESASSTAKVIPLVQAPSVESACEQDEAKVDEVLVAEEVV